MDKTSDELSTRFPLTFPDAEREYIVNAIRSAHFIVEYGSGGSTWLAASFEGKKIVSVESDVAWAQELRQAISASNLASTPKIIWADIGPTRKWGRPTDFLNWHNFLTYPSSPWVQDPECDPDLVIIDGRFRVACFVATLMSIKRPTLVIVDDYASRPEYKAMEVYAARPEMIGRMAVFKLMPKATFSNEEFLKLVAGFFDELESREARPYVESSVIKAERLAAELGRTMSALASFKKQDESKSKELDLLRRRYKRQKRLLIPLAVPVIFLLAPIIFPLYLARLIFRKFRKKFNYRSSFNKDTIVYEAFIECKKNGLTAAFSILEPVANQLPAGTLDVFRTIGAADDRKWLASVNKWATARGIPRIRLTDQGSTRFQRISFEAVESVADGDLVSIIIPCFNAEGTVQRAIQSILDQTWKNIEVLAVNDCSTDQTGTVLETMAQKDPRLTVIHNCKNVGPYVSKNRGLRLARGRYVTGHDADDIAIPNRIAVQMEPILNNPSCKATVGHMIRLDEQGRPCHLAKVGPFSYDGVCRIASISLLIDRDLLLDRVGFWDSVRYGADSEFIARLEYALGHAPTKINAAVMLCLWSEGSLTGNLDTGIRLSGGLSPTRATYRESWRDWHESGALGELKLPFPLAIRRFEAPPSMIVPHADVEAVVADDVSEALEGDLPR